MKRIKKYKYLLGILTMSIFLLGFNYNDRYNNVINNEQKILELNKEIENKDKEITNLVKSISVYQEQTNALKEDLKKSKENGKMQYLGKFTLTYYCGENYPHICGSGKGITSTGHVATEGITVAVDKNVIPLNSALYIDGAGVRLAQDTGGAIKGNKIDVFVSSHEEALKLGKTTNIDVWIIK